MVSLYDGDYLCYDHVAHLNWISLDEIDQDSSNGAKFVYKMALNESRIRISHYCLWNQQAKWWWVFSAVIIFTTIKPLVQKEYCSTQQIHTDWRLVPNLSYNPPFSRSRVRVFKIQWHHQKEATFSHFASIEWLSRLGNRNHKTFQFWNCWYWLVFFLFNK